jgi:Spy/CpxP family protein refolding chaperone
MAPRVLVEGMKTQTIRTRSVWGLAASLLVAAVGCGGSAPQATAPAGAATTSDVAPAGTTPAEDEDESTADLREHHRHHHHGGFAMFIAMSLDSLGTTPEQSAAITKIQSDLHAKMQPAHDAEKNVLSMLADGIAAGNIDKAKVDAAIGQVSAVGAGVHDAVADSLNQLHATLTPSQRAALVDKIEAHFAVWHHANSEDETVDRDAHGGHLGRLAKDVGLSPEQVEKIRAGFKASIGGGHFDRKEGEEHLKAFGKAFASDPFDAKTLTTGTAANAHMATWGVTRMACFYEAATPVLTPDQRTKVAESLRRHANYKRSQTGT